MQLQPIRLAFLTGTHPYRVPNANSPHTVSTVVHSPTHYLSINASCQYLLVETISLFKSTYHGALRFLNRARPESVGLRPQHAPAFDALSRGRCEPHRMRKRRFHRNHRFPYETRPINATRIAQRGWVRQQSPHCTTMKVRPSASFIDGGILDLSIILRASSYRWLSFPLLYAHPVGTCYWKRREVSNRPIVGISTVSLCGCDCPVQGLPQPQPHPRSV